MSDELLITRFIKGETAAFNTLVWRWQKPIYNFILRYIGNSDLARDLTQITFIRAFKGLVKLRDRSKFSSWLYQIAVNLCRDEIRKHKFNLVSLDDWQTQNEEQGNPASLAGSDTRDPLSEMNNNNLAVILNKALQAIPEEQRVVIIMKEYHGLKFIEIAQTLKLPVNTVKSRMYYGLTALRKILKEWNITAEDFQYEM